MDEKTYSVLKDARHAILWLSNPQLRERCEDRLPRTDIVEAIDALLAIGFARPGETWCKHCERWRKERDCRADPFVNAEPRTYCPVAERKREAFDEASALCARQNAQVAGEG